jgi:large subunit ribosomal protein L22
MEARASAHHIRISARKARLVADLIRGKSVEEALSILALTQKKASPILRKVMLSAAANVRFQDDGGHPLPDARLYVREIRIDEGPTMKRIRPRSQGRAYSIFKRTAHIDIRVAADV